MDISSTTNAIIASVVAHPPIDWIIFVVVLVVIMIDALRSGTARAATLALSLPITVFLVDILSRTFFLGPIMEKFPQQLVQAGIFAFILIIMAILIYRMMYAYSTRTNTPSSAMIGALAATIILFAIWFQVPVLQSVWHFGPQVQAIFGTAYTFWWLLAAYLLMAFVRS